MYIRMYIYIYIDIDIYIYTDIPRLLIVSWSSQLILNKAQKKTPEKSAPLEAPAAPAVVAWKSEKCSRPPTSAYIYIYIQTYVYI